MMKNNIYEVENSLTGYHEHWQATTPLDAAKRAFRYIDKELPVTQRPSTLHVRVMNQPLKPKTSRLSRFAGLMTVEHTPSIFTQRDGKVVKV